MTGTEKRIVRIEKMTSRLSVCHSRVTGRLGNCDQSLGKAGI